MGRSPRASRDAFTLIELLVVLGILSLLIGLLLPSLTAARNEGFRLKCLTNLGAIAQSFGAYAADDSEGYLIPVHPQAEHGWTFDGEYEYGGAASVLPGALGNIYRGPMGPSSRVLNRFLYGAAIEGMDFKMFRCPGDSGIVDAPKNFDSALPFNVPLVDVTGTSYRINNHIRMYTDRYFYGPYLRRVNRIPETGSTVVLAETCAQVAIYNPPPFVAPGWHRQSMRYNASFADGHSAMINIQGGNELPRADFAGQWYFRGDGWRLDCYPDAPIKDLW